MALRPLGTSGILPLGRGKIRLGVPRGGILVIPIVGLSLGGNDSPLGMSGIPFGSPPVGGNDSPNLGRGKVRLGIPRGGSLQIPVVWVSPWGGVTLLLGWGNPV
jgi:hypothetical protein